MNIPTYAEEHNHLYRVFNKNPGDVVIAIDFDGTLAHHEYPKCGSLVPFAKETVLKLQAHNVRWILWTMRSGRHLEEAVSMLRLEGLRPWGVNHNEEQTWTTSPKCYAQLYIDDAAFGVPLIKDEWSDREFVDWRPIYKHLFGTEVQNQ